MSEYNLLFLYTDEQRPDTCAAYGNRRIETPNLNRLAEQSTVFERAYCTQPVCTPARGSLVNGLWPHTHGAVMNNLFMREGVRCLPEWLPPRRWFCAHHGKWHLGDELYPQHGFTEWVATEDTYHHWYRPHRDQRDRSPYHHYLISQGIQPAPNKLPPEIGSRFFREQIHRLPEEHSRPAFLGREASRFIRENARRPFILFVNFLEPHMPFHSCRDGQYRPQDVILPGNSGIAPAPDHSLRARLDAARRRAKTFEGRVLDGEGPWRELTARYWGMCSLVDTHVGKILETLHDCGLDDKTIVVFTSDHGDMMSSHGLVGKGLMYEESARVPFLLRLPGQKGGRRVSGPVSMIDVVPTLFDLLGLPIPPELQGLSLRAALEGGREEIDRPVFIEWNRGGPPKPLATLPSFCEGMCTLQEAEDAENEELRAVVTPDLFKYNWSATGHDELFDLNADPLELRNAAREPAHSARIAAMRERIRAWQAETKDELRLGE
jgi:arylsulfatase A-like enzyme